MRRPDIKVSVSHTTRPARPMEREGLHYHFISPRQFQAMRDSGDFLEWAEVHGNYYATGREPVQEWLRRGFDVILEIDVQGAAQVKEKMPDAALIFIEAPSIEILERRLRNRGTETDEQLERRRADAYDELRKKDSFDGVIVNVDVSQAVEEVLVLMDRLKQEKPTQ